MQKTQPYSEKVKSGVRLAVITGDQSYMDMLLRYARHRTDLEVVHFPTLEPLQDEPNPVGRFDAVVFDSKTSRLDLPVRRSLTTIFGDSPKIVMGDGEPVADMTSVDKGKGITELLRAVTDACGPLGGS